MATRRRTATERPRPKPDDDDFQSFPLESHRDVGFTARAHRVQLEIRQSELAERVGVSRQWICEFERGKATAELGLAIRVYKELEIELFASALFVKPVWSRYLVRGRAKAREAAINNPRNRRRRVLRKTKKVARLRLLALILARADGPAAEMV